MNARGISLIELCLVSGLMGTLALVIAFGMRQSQELNALYQESENLATEILELSPLIQSVGRTSQSCQKLAGPILHCNVLPADGGAYNVQFIFTPPLPDTPGVFSYVRETSPGTWETKRTVSGIDEFILCNDADLAGGTCPLDTAAFNALHTFYLTDPAVLDPSQPGRYFRYRLNAVSNGKRVKGTKNFIQGSFFVRNHPSLPIVYLGGI